MRNFQFCYLLAFAFAISVSGQDTKEEDVQTETLQEEYKHVFQNMPQLIENMIQALKEKPEILERNDFDTFKRSADQGIMSCGEVGDEDGKDFNDNDNVDSENSGSLVEEPDYAYPAFSHELKYLSPEEIAQRAIEIEHELEEYNNSN